MAIEIPTLVQGMATALRAALRAGRTIAWTRGPQRSGARCGIKNATQPIRNGQTSWRRRRQRSLVNGEVPALLAAQAWAGGRTWDGRRRSKQTRPHRKTGWTSSLQSCNGSVLRSRMRGDVVPRSSQQQQQQAAAGSSSMVMTSRVPTTAARGEAKAYQVTVLELAAELPVVTSRGCEEEEEEEEQDRRKRALRRRTRGCAVCERRTKLGGIHS